MRYLFYGVTILINIAICYHGRKLDMDQDGIRQLGLAVGILIAAILSIVVLANIISSVFLMLLDLIGIIFAIKVIMCLILFFIDEVLII